MAHRKLTEYLYLALSSDVKTTVGVTTGARTTETDTDTDWCFDGIIWYKLSNVTFSVEHKRVHEGVMWDISELYETVGNNNEANLVIEHTIQLHAAFQIASEGAAFVSIFEAPTITGGTGTNAIITNARRPTGDSGAPTALKNPTITDDGTKLAEWYSPGGSGGNANGWAADRLSEIILTADTKYLFRMVNKKGGNADMSWVLHAYEFLDD